MLKSKKLALTVLVVAATAFSFAGCRTGRNAPAQATYGSQPSYSQPSYSQGSGTVSPPAYNGGSGSRPMSNPAYNGGGSGSRSYGGGGSGSR